MRFVLLHYHIFKNAGSTLEDILDHSFGGRFGRLDTPADGGLIENPDLLRHLEANPGLCAFSSHQIRYPLPKAPGYLFFDICFLRDPLDRVRSFYDYFRQRPNPADPMSALANSVSLGDFVAGMIADHSLFIRNNQVNLLACGGDSDEPNDGDLELATRRMLASSFLGVVDCFEQSAVGGMHALRSAFPELDCARPAVNVSRGMQGTVADRTAELRDTCRPEVYDELLRITALDRELVKRARAEVMGRFERVQPNHPSEDRRKSPSHIHTHTPRGRLSLATAARRFIRLVPFWRELAGRGRAALFDADYYGGSLSDFLLRGGYEGRQPHPLFDPAYYLRKYPDVAAAGVNPLCHYLKYGRAQLRQPNPLFDPSFYLDRYPDVRRAGLDPLLHYLHDGAAEGRKPHPLFDPAYYRAPCGNPLIHFLGCGAQARNPHPLFDCDAYAAAHPDVADQDLNPLVHYLESRVTKSAAFQADVVIPIDVMDVPLVVACVSVAPETPPAGGIAVVWEDRSEVTHWIAEPQQLPFLEAVSADQIRAQLASQSATG